MVTLNIKKADKLALVAEVMASETHMAGVKSCIERELDRIGLSGEEFAVAARVGWDDASISVVVNMVFDDFEHYDKFLSSEYGVISSTERVAISFRRTVIAVPQMVNTIITFDFLCPLDPDDLETLRMLGKVHTAIEPAYRTESVACVI